VQVVFRQLDVGHLSVFSCRLSAGLFYEGVVDPVGLSAELQEPAVVHNPVNDGGSHVVIAEHGSPPGELQVCGDDQAAFFVAVRYDLEEQLSCRGDFGQRNWWIPLRCQGWLLITMVDFVRPPVAERGVTAPGVVKPLDVAHDVAPACGLVA
jgi:hypothetical protein